MRGDGVIGPEVTRGSKLICLFCPGDEVRAYLNCPKAEYVQYYPGLTNEVVDSCQRILLE